MLFVKILVVVTSIIICLQKLTVSVNVNSVACNQTLVQSFLSCDGPLWSCQGKCGQHQVLPCSCDEHCIIYSNCCEDFKDECSDLFYNSSQTWKEYLSLEVKCKDNARESLISGCPNTTLDLDSYERCSSDDPTSFEDIVPVTDVSSGLQFKNIHCHRCSVNTGLAQQWTGIFSVKGDNLEVVPHTLGDMLVFMNQSLIKVFWVPPLLKRNRPCDEQTKNRCNVCSNSQQQSLCDDFISYVMVITETGQYHLYRNKYCAACDYAMSNNSCDSPAIKYFTVSGRNPFSFILQFNRADSLWKFKARNGIMAWKTIQCGKNTSFCQYTECSASVPFMNSSCPVDLRYFVLSVKIRLENYNKELITKTTRKRITDNITRIKSYYNSSFDWETRDKSSELADWDFVFEMITYHKLNKRPCCNDCGNTSTLQILTSNVTDVLRHESFRGNLSVCFRVDTKIRTVPWRLCYDRFLLKVELRGEVKTNTGILYSTTDVYIVLYAMQIWMVIHMNT